MTKKNQRFFNVLMVLGSLMSLLFFGKEKLKRFFPVSLIMVLFELISCMIGKKRKWWVFFNNPKSFLFNEFPFHLGPFIVCSLWISRFTMGNFKKFVLTNAIFNGFFAFPFMAIATKIKYFKLVNLNNFQFFLNFFYKSFILYALQKLFDRYYKPVK
jgi:uncharacterized membrane protein YfcA